MNGASPSEPDTTVKKEAAAWVARLDAGPLDDQEHRVFREWVSRRPENKLALDQLQRFWGQLEHCIPAETGFPAKRSPWKRGAIAAAAICATFVLFFVSPLERSPNIIEYHTARTTAEHVLEDGSQLTLNADSSVRIDFSGSERRVELLHGEALFEVEPASRPFIVTAYPARIEVVGTVFDVVRRHEELKVAVLKGKVIVDVVSAHAQPDRQTGESGQELLVDSVGEISVRPIADSEQVTAWVSGRLVFRGDPLARVIETVNRHSDTEVVLDPGIDGSQPVFGAFRSGDADAVVSALTDALDLETQRLPEGRIRLSPRQAH